MNQTLFQFFHWYYSAEGNLWQHAAAEADRLASLGITQVWLPPAYKSSHGAEEPGYAVYDLYDLGEFDQKGSVRTRYGTRDEYLAAIQSFHDKGIQVFADVVLNHKHGADEQEEITVRKVKADNRKEFVSGDERVQAYTKFTFPGRNWKYSQFLWDYRCFTGICENGTISMIMNEYSNGQWEEMIEDEMGNFDYLMANDIEFRNPFVREELKKWGEWYLETTGVDGFRLDALKHISPGFYPEWLGHLDDHFKKRIPCIGEYWRYDVRPLLKYADRTGGRIQLFDAPLHFNFHNASQQNDQYDLRKIFDNTLVQARPELAVTFVDNHDTQPLQSLESTVDFWFKPIANAIILLRDAGYPCVFYPSVYEAKYSEKKNGEDIHVEMNKVPGIEELMKMRAQSAYGLQRDYFDHPNFVGWTREGTDDMPDSGLAVVISNAGDGDKIMSLGSRHTGRRMHAVLGNHEEIVQLDGEGQGRFPVHGRSLSAWIPENKTIK